MPLRAAYQVSIISRSLIPIKTKKGRTAVELTFPATHRGRLDILVNEHRSWVAAIDNGCRLQVVKVLLVDVDSVVLEDAKLDTLCVGGESTQVRSNSNFSRKSFTHLAHPWHLKGEKRENEKTSLEEPLPVANTWVTKVSSFSSLRRYRSVCSLSR